MKICPPFLRRVRSGSPNVSRSLASSTKYRLIHSSFKVRKAVESSPASRARISIVGSIPRESSLLAAVAVIESIGHLSFISLLLQLHDVQYLVHLDYDVSSMDRDLELRHLRYFVAVAEELHFGRAARRLHLSQPPLSQQIRKLEEILGYALFVRTSRSVTLTKAGEDFLERARRTLRNVQRDMDETRSIGRGEVGSLNIGFVGSAMLTPLLGVVRTYREANPRVNLRLYESFTAHVAEGLENGTLDV